MAILRGAFLLTITITCLTQSRACELIPSNDGSSCLKLKATPYIKSVSSQFGPTIEGAGVNPAGDIFAVNYGTRETIFQLGEVFPEQKLFYTDTNQSSLLNGIRFLNSYTAFVADAANHRVLKLILGPGNNVLKSENYCSDPNMLQPNDLTLSSTGTVYTSGMKWSADTENTHGDIWSCLPDGKMQKLDALGRTNGIDLSPDERYLYVSESYNRGGVPISQKIWKYKINAVKGTIDSKTLFADFEKLDKSGSVDIDGMRTDLRGNLFVIRNGGSHVAVLSPEGKLIGKIEVSFKNPTNLEFGGPTGTTLFIIGRCIREDKGCVDQIELVTPGHAWSMLQSTKRR